MQNNSLEQLFQSMREAFEKIERAFQLPTRRDFEAMNERVSALFRRLEELEKSKVQGLAAAKERAPAKVASARESARKATKGSKK